MGFESHVDRVLEDAKIVRWLYEWNDGMIVEDNVDAEIIMDILDNSGEFGPSRYNKETKKIEFGVHDSFAEDMGIIDYKTYCEKFKNFEINHNYGFTD